MTEPIRILTAVPICDGHDSAILTINAELMRHGVEVIYLGYNRSARDIARAAVQEDVRAVGISSYNGGHIEFFSEVLAFLRKWNGRTSEYLAAEEAPLQNRTPHHAAARGGQDILCWNAVCEMIRFVKERYGRPVSGRRVKTLQTVLQELSRVRRLWSESQDREAWARRRSSTSWSCGSCVQVPSGVSRFFRMIQVRPARGVAGRSGGDDLFAERPRLHA